MILVMQGELVVAGVFVRVYNEQPTFLVSDPPSFCKGLVSYLHVRTHSPLFRAAQTDMQQSPVEGKHKLCSARFLLALQERSASTHLRISDKSAGTWLW